jgi:allantoin racemase
MHLNIVNPNTTAAMTRIIAAAAARVARPGTTIRAVESEFGPASIEGHYDDAFAVPGLLLRIAEGETEGVDAHVIACFDDTGLDAARTLADAPVVGIGEAAFHTASLLAHRFAVVTTLARSIPVIETNLLRYGLERRARACAPPTFRCWSSISRARMRAHGSRRRLN